MVCTIDKTWIKPIKAKQSYWCANLQLKKQGRKRVCTVLSACTEKLVFMYPDRNLRLLFPLLHTNTCIIKLQMTAERRGRSEMSVCSYWLQLGPGFPTSRWHNQIFSLLDNQQSSLTHWQAFEKLWSLWMYSNCCSQERTRFTSDLGIFVSILRNPSARRKSWLKILLNFAPTGSIPVYSKYRYWHWYFIWLDRYRQWSTHW